MSERRINIDSDNKRKKSEKGEDIDNKNNVPTNRDEDYASSDCDDEDYVPTDCEDDDESNESNGEDEGNKVESANDDNAVTKVPIKIDEEKLDKLWEKFIGNASKPKEDSINGKQENKTVLNEYNFAGEKIVVQEGVNNKNCGKDLVPTKRKSNSMNILKQMKKPKKISVLEKSALDWRQYKEESGFKFDLEQHLRSKDSYLNKEAFLQRTELRQFEIEKGKKFKF